MYIHIYTFLEPAKSPLQMGGTKSPALSPPPSLYESIFFLVVSPTLDIIKL